MLAKFKSPSLSICQLKSSQNTQQQQQQLHFDQQDNRNVR